VVTPHKGVHLIVEAAAAAGVAASLLIAGAQPDRRYLDRLRSLAADVPDLTLRFTGKYDRSELSTLLAAVDAVVVPSRVPESFSMTTREALVRGIPVVVADSGALSEAIEDGVNGWTFESNSAPGLAEVLRRLAADRRELTKARGNAHRYQTPSAEDHAERMLELYALAAASPPVFDARAAEAIALGEAVASYSR
jgi:glycosyltransferase involved in cell wall biosynthesis